ncbi:MAG: acyl-CoA dehydrogenase family protein, partial [Nitriliruptorales bacterium]
MTTIDQQGFFQDPPGLRDEWEDDRALRAYLRRVLPPEVLSEVTPALAELGWLAASDLYELHLEMDRPESEPRLVRFDAWGRRVDRIETAPAWKEIGRHAARHGIVAAGYEDRFGAHDRVHQFALAYLFTPSSGLYGCPLAMTDGAAKTLLVHGDRNLVDRTVPRLTTRDPDEMWTSGQWMTERTGGSDVGLSETVARRGDDGTWRLHGTKWFTSATTADCALALARPEGASEGSRGLGLFLVERIDPRSGQTQLGSTILVNRLKDKLGTRALPTAELTLAGAYATPVGSVDNGLKKIAGMLNVTRTHNA